MLFERRAASVVAEPNAYGERVRVREKSTTGQIITPESALSVPAVLAAFTILSEDISSLPLILYLRKTGGDKERAWSSPYYRLMHDTPNPEHTSMVFREIMMAHLLAWGNFYGQIIIDQAGTVTEIWPLRPDRMTVERKNGARIYHYITSAGKERTFYNDEILHIPSFGFDGLVGYSRIALARNAIGLALSTETYGSKFFDNDARPGVVLKHPNKLSQPAYDRLAESWDDKHKGTEKSHGTAILEEGLDIVTIGIPPEDAQFLETRKFQLGEIARLFRVPSFLIGDTEKSTSWGTGLDSQEQAYISHTLRPWTIRIEQFLNRDLLLPGESGLYYYEHLFDGLLRGDLATRYAAYVQAINNGWMSPNEVRGRENMNKYEGGDEFYRPLNMTSATNPPPAPAPAQPKASRSALEPLFADVAQRVVKRECNDLRGANRRFLAKGQSQSFIDFVVQFYGKDQPDFIQRQFAPVLAVLRSLTGQDGSELLQSYFVSYFDQRLASLEGLNAEEIETKLDGWLANAPEEITRAIKSIVLEAV